MTDASDRQAIRARLDAALTLAASGDFSLLPVILEGLAHPDATIRLTAADLSEHIGAPAAVDLLRAMVTADPDPGNRNQAMYALTAIGRPAGVPALITALADADADRRLDARTALYRLIGDDALRVLGDEEFGDRPDPEEQERVATWWDDRASAYDQRRSYAFGRLATPGVFVDRLDVTQTEVPDAILGALNDWTGEDFGESPLPRLRQAWRHWWTEHEAGYEPGRRYFHGHPVP